MLFRSRAHLQQSLQPLALLGRHRVSSPICFPIPRTARWRAPWTAPCTTALCKPRATSANRLGPGCGQGQPGVGVTSWGAGGGARCARLAVVWRTLGIDPIGATRTRQANLWCCVDMRQDDDPRPRETPRMIRLKEGHPVQSLATAGQIAHSREVCVRTPRALPSMHRLRLRTRIFLLLLGVFLLAGALLSWHLWLDQRQRLQSEIGRAHV